VKNSKRKKTLIFVVSVVSALVLIFASMTVYFFATTMSVDECIEYCKEHSLRSAETFTRYGDGRYAADYAYWVAEDGDTTKPQELFVFKRKLLLGSISAFDRYYFVVSSVDESLKTDTVDTNNRVGSLQFTTRNDKGVKEQTSTLLFFASNINYESRVMRYECKMETNDGVETLTGNVPSYGNDSWLLNFKDIGTNNEITKKVIEVKFFDENGALVFEY